MFDVLEENECQFPDTNSRPRNKHGFLQPDIGEHVRCPFPRQEKVQLSWGQGDSEMIRSCQLIKPIF